MESIPKLLADIDADDEIRAVVLTGAGDKAFSAGADIKEFERPAAPRSVLAPTGTPCTTPAGRSTASRSPPIAAIRGYCLGGGLELALYADIRIASTDARFGLPAAKRGIAVSHDHIDRLARLAGPGDTAYLMLTGRTIPAERALSSGVVSLLVEGEGAPGRGRGARSGDRRAFAGLPSLP